MVLENKKRQKTLHNCNVGVEEDKISNLPDALIHRILSFLPIKCAMSTCILSRKWKYVSNSIPILDFREWRGTDITAEEKRLETQLFMNFLDTVLYLHEKPNIQKFCLKWDHLFDESRVTKWISVVIKRKVEELFLSVRTQISFVFPLSLFTYNSLTVLNLACLTIKVSNTVSFPRLKLLRLSFIEFENGISPNHLLSNCPILEELSLMHCSGFQSDGLCITNPALKHLYISNCYLAESTVKICTTNLTTISCSLVKPPDFVVDNFPSLVEACIIFCDGDKIPINVFEKLSNVKLLKLPAACFLGQHEADNLLTILPAFGNLVRIEVTSTFNCKSLGSDSVSILRRFFSLLQLPPNLESIVFSQSIYIPDEEDDDCWSLDPKCSLPHLKFIKFKYFDGGRMELNGIKVFLKCAGFLETVTVVASPVLSKNHQHQLRVTKQLLMFPKPANCLVKFLMSSEDT